VKVQKSPQNDASKNGQFQNQMGNKKSRHFRIGFGAPSRDQIVRTTPQQPTDYKRRALPAVALSDGHLPTQMGNKKADTFVSALEPPAGIKPATY
jgi:hypothetical protein